MRAKDVLREIREKASDSLKNCHPKPLQIIQISEWNNPVKALRCSWIRTWDGVRGLPGVSFESPKRQPKLETSAANAENAFVSILLYPTNVRKEKRESGLV